METLRAKPLSRVEFMVSLSLFLGGLLLRPLLDAELVMELDDFKRDGIIRTMAKERGETRGTGPVYQRDARHAGGTEPPERGGLRTLWPCRRAEAKTDWAD